MDRDEELAPLHPMMPRDEQLVREEAAELNRRRPLTEADEIRFQSLLDWLECRIRYDGAMGILDTNWEYFSPWKFIMRPTKDHQRPRILILFHDEGLAESFAIVLGAAGYKCDAVWDHKSTMKAMKRVKKDQYDLLFCRVGALEAEKELLAWVMGSGKRTPLVVTSGAWSLEDVPEPIRKRCCAFLQMPVEREELVALIHKVFAC